MNGSGGISLVEKKILRLLIVDDSPDDAELASTVLRRHGYMLKQNRVQDLAGLQAALDKGHWDAVICEFGLAHLNMQVAQDLLRRAGLDLPLVVYTRAIGDDDLIKVMRAGAHDVVLKNQSARLGPAMERELQAAENRRALAEVRQKLTETETKSRAVIEGSHEALCYLQDGMHVEANLAYLELFGYRNLDELTGIPVMNLIDKAEQARFKTLLRKPPADRPEPQEFTAVKADGSHFPVTATLSAITLNGEKCLQLLVSDISKRKAVESKLQYLNQHDPLTGLFNRHHFLQELARAIERVRAGEAAAVIYMDLEQLKQINDALSYAAGDRLLIKVTRLLREHFGNDAVLARLGGDELAVLIYGHGEEELRKTAERVRKALKDTAFSEGGKTFHCDCKLTATPVDGRAENAQQVLSDAYRALRKAAPASAAVPSVTEIPAAPPPPEPAPVAAAPKPAASAPAAGNWVTRLQQALERDGFTLAYQPIVNLHGEPAEYFEVLLRLVGDNDQLISAGEFMPEAERSGISGMIDRWVVRNAIEALGALHREGRQASFFINLSPVAFRDADLLPSAIRWMREANVKPGFVVFETDESTVLAHTAAVTTFVKATAKIGARFALDNFGRNLSNTDYLRDLPINYLKVDGQLIRNLPADPVSQAALRAVVGVAQGLAVQTIAKCVEKAENLAALWNYGLDYVQGHYFESGAAEGGFDAAEEATLSSEAASAPSWASSRAGR
jgi:diguanylate cyclase (GGDEF)-like protein/PAS domain S-box-containing protein